MGKLNSRRRRAKKKRENREKAESPSSESTESESPPKTPFKTPESPSSESPKTPFKTPFKPTPDSFDQKLLREKEIMFCAGLRNSFLKPLLRPRFPQRRETLSLDAGFAQTPVLKRILGHYHDYIPSANDFVTKSFSLDSRLMDVYSKIAPYVVSVSSFFGVERKIDCSGFIIDWCPAEKEGTVVTSAKVLWSPAYSDCEFHLIVRMANGKLFLAKEDRVDFYNNILTLKVKSEVELKALDLRGDIVLEIKALDLRGGIVPEGGMRVIAVGRSFYTYSFIDYAGELYEGYPHFGCLELLRSSCRAPQICEGGPLITDTGHVLGMNFYGNGDSAHLLPIGVIRSCLEMWRFPGTVSRPWIGFSVADVKQSPFHLQEKLNSYVVVKEVFDETLDLHSSDSVVSVNGTPIQSAKQYSRLLSGAVTDCADSSKPIQVVMSPFGSTADVSYIADYLSVDDTIFCYCWPQLDADEWLREKYGTEKNPLYSWPPSA